MEVRVNYRKLGRTGLEVSEVGYGAWGIGKSQWMGAEDGQSLRALNRAIDLGLTFIDKALGLGGGDWRGGVEALKREGKIRHFGVSINDHQPANAIKLIESGLVDTVQVIYNVFDQSPEDELLP